MKDRSNILFEVSLVPESDKDSATYHAVYSSLWLNPGDSIHCYICREKHFNIKNIKRETEFVYAISLCIFFTANNHLELNTSALFPKI